MSENKEKTVESHSPKKSGCKQSILANTSIALNICHPLVADSSLGIASIPKNNEEQSIKKKARVYIQKCMVCKKVGKEICNRAFFFTNCSSLFLGIDAIPREESATRG